MKIRFLHFFKLTLALLLFLQVEEVSAQTNRIVWTPTTTGQNTITGSYPGGTVTVTNVGTGADMTLATSGLNLKVSGAATLPMKNLRFTFSTPVVINKLYASGFESSAAYHDEVYFTGLNFSTYTASDPALITVTSNSAKPIVATGSSATFLSSTAVISTFDMTFPPLGTLKTITTYYDLYATDPCKVAPIPSATSISNCPSATINLNSLVSSTPADTVLKWYSNASHTTLVVNPSSVTTSGTYYAFYYDNVAACYSPASAAVTATVSACCPTTAPTVN